ncbi:MAG: hypothetical protein QOD99_2472 [Chthoniobacter sp.]|jgi:putative two-component system response regulator|nr:hypothetical protein [Chthoniobacter sp.]
MTDASLRKARILIVDDQIANISLLENILRRIGYTFLRGVTDSRNAVAEVAEFAPDLILLDLNMPNVDGFAIMKQLAEVTARETFLPVLVLTADATAATKRKALATGATDFCISLSIPRKFLCASETCSTGGFSTSPWSCRLPKGHASWKRHF